ncbi:MAG: hypothetical protein LUE88_06765 [Clostridiales bacterium]|nr:hypothetical protein [Clostridiales bacterium]
MELKSFKCPNCGAELNIKEGAKQVKCEYCLSVVKIKNAEPKITMQKTEPEQFNRPSGMTSESLLKDVSPVVSRSNIRLIVKIVIGVFSVILWFWDIIFALTGLMLLVDGDMFAAIVSIVIAVFLFVGPIIARKKILRRF